ncbi:MAG: hypothetical protein AYL28_003950 [Candidatus Bathyarchaeota archaeon B23]|nr:MAG: hypothetical protein AYL28_003950 [Candidatus Bathyarchaeota archaeon B23]
MRRHYGEAESLEELCLDASALKGLALVLERQSRWIRHRSSTLYRDPFLLTRRLMEMDVRAIAMAFLSSWHPVVELEQATADTLLHSLRYWEGLLPLEERWRGIEVEERWPGHLSREEAEALGILVPGGFEEALRELWRELRGRGPVDYWDWIGAESYEETLRRAFLTSYLVSYGYATLHMDRYSERLLLEPVEEPEEREEEGRRSLPVMVDEEEWERWRGGLMGGG